MPTPPLRDPVPFARFMEEALYGEGGYYRREPFPVGVTGDYVTGSSFSPLFARTTARLLRRLDIALGRRADYLEAGYGAGVHLRNLMTALVGPHPLSPSPASGRGGTIAGELPCLERREEGDRRLLAWDRVPRPLPEGVESLSDLAGIPDRSIDGLIFSYELFDALPFHRLIGRADGSLGELWVERAERGAGEGSADRGPSRSSEPGASADPSYAWREGELSDPSLADLLGPPSARLAPHAKNSTLLPGQIADLAPGWAPLYGALARRLGRGLVVTCDYGFERPLLLDPRVRMHGTLAAYFRHQVHRNPFVRVGAQDLTAHVDFTALIEAGEAEGLETLAFTRQSLWLAACGLFEELAEVPLATRHEAMALLDGEGMGEEIRVLVQGRGVELRALVPPEALAAL